MNSKPELKPTNYTAIWMWSKVMAIVIISVSAILFLFWVTATFVYFPTRIVSTQLNDLGLYGDFLGGTLGTLVSIASLGVTIYLAIILHRLEKENASSSIKAQRHIALMQMKYQELATFRANCDAALDILSCMPGPTVEIDKGYKQFKNSVDRLITLYPELKNTVGFRIPSIYLMQANDYNTHFLNSKGNINYEPEDVDNILTSMLDCLQKGREGYLESVRQLREWTFE